MAGLQVKHLAESVPVESVPGSLPAGTVMVVARLYSEGGRHKLDPGWSSGLALPSLARGLGPLMPGYHRTQVRSDAP